MNWQVTVETHVVIQSMTRKPDLFPRSSALSCLRLLALLALLVSLSACRMLNPLNWFSDDEVEQPAELTAINQQVPMRRLWSVSVGNGQGKLYNKLTPILDGGVLYVASEDGEVLAINSVNGNIQWRNRTRETITGGVGAGRGMVMVGTENAEVLVLNQTDGSLLWRAPVSSEVLSAPQTNGDIVVLQTVDDKLIALDADDGSQRWIYETTLPVLTLRGTSNPLIAQNAVLAGFSNGTVVAVNAQDGVWRWEERVAVPQGRYDIERVIDVDGDLMLAGGNVVLASSYQGNLMGFDIQSGRIVWGLEASSYHGLAEGFGNIYYCDQRGHIVAVRSGSDTEVWRNDSLDLRRVSAPTTFNNYVVVADFEGYVHLLSQLDGQVVGRLRVDNNGVRARPIVGNNTLFVYGNSGRLTAIALQ
ncbi:MAG: outer membrane protein assembly factor BamB [Pseudohongiellaceae bacterium]